MHPDLDIEFLFLTGLFFCLHLGCFFTVKLLSDGCRLKKKNLTRQDYIFSGKGREEYEAGDVETKQTDWQYRKGTGCTVNCHEACLHIHLVKKEENK